MSEIAYAWVIDGVDTIFVTREDLDDTWAAAQGFDRTHAGLVMPDSLPCALDIRDGFFDDTTAELKIDDLDGTLAALFASALSSAESLIFTIEAGGTAPASTWGKHVGLEAIGPAGERRRYSCVPGFNVGMRHFGQVEAYELGLASTPVTDSPVLWPGRRCAVYRVGDPFGSGWQNLDEAQRVWWGTLLNGSQKKRTWAWRCAGPESWCMGNLGREVFEDSQRVIPLSTFDTAGLGEHRISGSLEVVELGDEADVRYTYVANYTDDTALVGAESYSDVATAMNTFLTHMESSNDGGDPPLDDWGASELRFETNGGADGVVVRWQRGLDQNIVGTGVTERSTLLLRVTAHEKTWRTLGFDVRTQNSDRDPVANPEQYGQFSGPINGAPGYWTGKFYSANAKAMAAFESGDYTGIGEAAVSNGGGKRRWPPIYPLGAVLFDGKSRQEFRLYTSDPVFWRGQASRPVLDDGDDPSSAFQLGDGVGAANRQGLMVFEGPYRRRGDEEKVSPVEGFAYTIARERREGRTVQVARVAWRESGDGSISTDTSGLPRLVIYRWEQPRLFGFDYDRYTGTWGGFRVPPKGAENIVARPLTAFEYGDNGDLATIVIQRVLLTTGTSPGWYTDDTYTTEAFGLGGAPTVEPGVNDTGGTMPKDAEVADLGLAVPASMVATPEEFNAAQTQVGNHLGRAKAVYYGPASARHLIRTLLAPTGLTMSLSGGKYGVIDPWVIPSPSDAVAMLTSEDYAGRPGDARSGMASQRLRLHGPIDRIECKGRVEPVAGDYEVTVRRKSSDRAASYRAQQLTHKIAADHLMSRRLSALGSGWQSELGIRWRQGFAFWGAQHFVADVSINANVAADIWPGDGVILSDPWLVDPAGEYGLEMGVARVIKRNFKPSGGKVDLQLIVNGETDVKIYAPGARVYRYDENDLGQGYRLLCRDDDLGTRKAGHFDVDGFEEPAWSSVGGDADIEIFQFNGVRWTRGIFGVVDSVNGEAGNSWIKLKGALTGNRYFRDMHHIAVMRTYAEQGAAWVKRWMAPICSSDGTHSGGVAGDRFRG